MFSFLAAISSSWPWARHWDSFSSAMAFSRFLSVCWRPEFQFASTSCGKGQQYVLKSWNTTSYKSMIFKSQKFTLPCHNITRLVKFRCNNRFGNVENVKCSGNEIIEVVVRVTHVFTARCRTASWHGQALPTFASLTRTLPEVFFISLHVSHLHT